MKRSLRAEEVRLWTIVATTVRPVQGRTLPAMPAEVADAPKATKAKISKRVRVVPPLSPTPAFTPVRRKLKPEPEPIEPLRKRRIARERDPIEARLDLHGLDQDRARVALHDFLHRAYAQGLRAVLVITGKGMLGDGVLRRRTPDWLAEPTVRPLIAGVSPAERHHGGEGALYIALKRNRP